MLTRVAQCSLGNTGYINEAAIKKYVPAPEMKEKVKVFVCGPPGQMTSIAGKKTGPTQGEYGGILKALGYSQDQVRFRFQLQSLLKYLK